MKEQLNEILNTIENEDLRELADLMVDTIPSYWENVWASSTGRYHPSYAVQNGGLMLHTIALCRIMNAIFEVTQYFNSRERDLLRIAGIMHDSRKSGSQEDYEKNKYTKFDHPLLAADVVREFKAGKWNDDEIELIANAIESHMGKWNTDKRSAVVLPTPENKYQYMLHVCDYLASRKWLEVVFDNVEPQKLADPMEVVIPFGKHKGTKLKDVPIDYLKWCKENISNMREPLRSAVDEVLKKFG